MLVLDGVTAFILLFFFKIIVDVQGLTAFNMNYRIFLSFSTKKKKKSLSKNFERHCFKAIMKLGISFPLFLVAVYRTSGG